MNRRRDWLVCLSYANLCFLDIWDRVESSWGNLPLRDPPSPDLIQFLGPVLIAVLVLALVLWAAVFGLRRLGNPLLLEIGAWAAVAGLLIPINLLRVEILHLSRQDLARVLGTAGAIAVVVAGVTCLLIIAVRWTAQLRTIPVTVALLLAPLLPIQILQKVWAFYRLPPASAYADKPAAPLLPSKPNAPRILWLVFDEMDQYLAFRGRPDSVKLPELDRLRGEAVYAEHARAAGMYTYEAMAAMMSGHFVREARMKGPDEILITYEGTREPVRLSEQPTVFSKARLAEFNTAVVGAALPYCRVINASLSSCHWEPSGRAEIALKGPALLARALSHLKTRPFALPFLTSTRGFRSPLFDADARREGRRTQIAEYEEIQKRALAIAADARYQLVLVHWPIPHLFGIYNRREGKYSLSDTSSYLDNLALVDRTLGELRRSLERSGQWDDTIVLVTADHPLRPWVNWTAGWWDAEDAAATKNVQQPDVPFLLKLQKQTRGVAFEAPFYTVLVHNLLLGLLAGTLDSPESVVAWLDLQRRRVPLEDPGSRMPVLDVH